MASRWKTSQKKIRKTLLAKESFQKLEKSNFSDLKYWSEDKHGKALDAFTKSCMRGKQISQTEIFSKVPKNITKEEWNKTCKLAKKYQAKNLDARKFFENNFVPYLRYLRFDLFSSSN